MILSKSVQDVFLDMLAELELQFSTNSIVIPSVEEMEKMIPCAAFASYFECCLKPLSMETIYKAQWKFDEDKKEVILRPMSYVTKDFKRVNFGKTREDLLKGKKAVEAGEEEIPPDQNIFMERIQLDLLHQEGGVSKFCNAMNKLKEDKFLGLKVSGVLVNVIWDLLYPHIIRYIFGTYFIYFLCFVIYISFFFDPLVPGPQFASYILLPYCILFSCIQLFLEVKQFLKERFSYFTEVTFIWNFFDIFSSIFVLMFSYFEFTGRVKDETTFIISSLAVFLLWLKLFYFMRLFKPTASFIRMIVDMFVDIQVFLLIFFTGILAFSNAYFILHFAKVPAKDGAGEDIPYEN